MKVQKFKRGQIWWYKTGVKFDGTTYNEGKPRPVIIMSNNMANANSSCLLAIPCTTQAKKDMPTHAKFYIDNTQNIALGENLMSVSTDKLDGYIGEVDEELIKELEKIILLALGLDNYVKEETPTNSVKVERVKKPPTIKEILGSKEKNNEEKSTIIPYNPKAATKNKRWTDVEKREFLDDYENHDREFILKKYNIKNDKYLNQKVYMIRKEFGLRVRSK